MSIHESNHLLVYYKDNTSTANGTNPMRWISSIEGISEVTLKKKSGCFVHVNANY
jgi:hypothetical protein